MLIAQAGDWTDLLQEWLDALAIKLQTYLTPWVFVQFAIIASCLLLAWLLARLATPPLEQRLRRIEGQPALLRLLVVVLRRLRWIILALLLWMATLILREVTWFSRSYFVGVAAALVTAFAIISIVSRVIRNRTLADAVAAVAWIVAALHILDLLQPTFALLDKAAVNLGDFRLSLLVILHSALIFALLAWTASVVSDVAERRLGRSDALPPAVQVLLGKGLRFSLIAIALLATISAVGINLTAFTVFSGAVGIGIGFGLQKVASNLISGIIILLDRSIKPGDVIALGETFGWISALKARYVSVITRDGVEYLIPNETFVTERLVNWSHSSPSIRLEIAFGVAYGSDPHLVRRLAVEAVRELPRVLTDQVPVCHVTGFGDSSIDFVLRFWIDDPQNGITNVRGQAYLAIWDAFKANGIEIPYPRREISVLRGKAALPDD